MHVRTKPGTRIEETARTVDTIEQMLRRIIPASQLIGIVDNLGIPYSGITFPITQQVPRVQPMVTSWYP